MNHLVNELSPYLLEHASNPVNWYPWSDTPFDEAVKLNIPIFLSIGYMACHWCHVMERESFENIEVANYLNKNFISIKVDREERPDIDKIYMDAILAMNGNGGWPLNMFLTPQGKPFFGGTYFPPESRYGIPGLKSVLISVINAWQENRNELIEQSNKVTNYIKQTDELDYSQNPKLSESNITNQILENFDMQFGGWGIQPKFPHAMTLDLLISNRELSNNKTRSAVIKTLDTMSLGGFYDILRGGFHRYSTDQKWLVPHFEKMLYDNALLAKTYLLAGKTYNNSTYLNITKSTLDFIKKELSDKKGGFYSSLDADSDGEEGLYYIWPPDELENSFSVEEWKNILNTFDIPQDGNFEGNIILRQKSIGPIPEVLYKLRSLQDKRTRPNTDDKILTDWNALAISAFAQAGRFFSDKEYIKAASNSADFIVSEMIKEGRLYHSWRNGETRQKAFLSDYSFLIIALFDLLSAEMNSKWLDYAYTLTNDMVELFWHENQFFDTGSDQNDLIIRPQSIEDNVVPSGWSSAIKAIINFSFFSGKTKFSDIIDNSIKKMIPIISKYPAAYPNWIDIILSKKKLQDYAVILQHQDDLQNANRMETICRKWLDLKTIFIAVPPDFSHPEKIDFLLGKRIVNDLSTAYICRNGTCSLPINNNIELLHQVKNDQ